MSKQRPDILQDWIDSKDDHNDSWQSTCRRSGDLLYNWIDESGTDPTDSGHTFTRYDIEEYKRHVNAYTNLSDNTIQNYCMASRDFIKFAYVEHPEPQAFDAVFDKGDPFSIYEADISAHGSEWESQTGDDIAYIEEDEHQQLIDENENPRDDVLLRTLWDTGCRPGELRELQLSDIDKQELIQNRRFEVDTAKRENHTRWLYISPTTSQRWSRWLNKGERKAYSNESYTSPYVFPTDRTDKMSKGTINRQIKRIADRADIQETGYTKKADHLLDGEYKTVEKEYVRINAKSYRAAFCVRACKSGINLDLLTELTGHSSAESLEPYTRYLPSDVEEAWERFIH